MKKYNILGDFHTHSTFSLHAYSSPTEIVDAAKERGLKYIAITDHVYTHDNTWPDGWFNKQNQDIRLNDMGNVIKTDGITVLSGGEFNLFRHDNTFISKYKGTNVKLIGYHNWFPPYGNRNINLLTAVKIGFEESLKRAPFYNIIAHPLREINRKSIYSTREIEEYIEYIIELSKMYDIAIELNEQDFRYMNDDVCILPMKRYIEMLKVNNAHICLGSDAHCKYDVGLFPRSLECLADVNYDESRIVNCDEAYIKKIFMKNDSSESDLHNKVKNLLSIMNTLPSNVDSTINRHVCLQWLKDYMLCYVSSSKHFSCNIKVLIFLRKIIHNCAENCIDVFFNSNIHENTTYYRIFELAHNMISSNDRTQYKLLFKYISEWEYKYIEK